MLGVSLDAAWHLHYTPTNECFKMKILSLSDNVVSFIYSPQVKSRFRDAGLILGCGDLPYHYLEYVYDSLDVPLYFVRGNHDEVVEYSSAGQRTYPHGGIDLHCKACAYNGLLLAGVEGSLRYRPGMFQYSQSDMWLNVLKLAPALLANRLAHGRYLDVFVSHAPPAGIHAETDLPHRGHRCLSLADRFFQANLFCPWSYPRSSP